MFCLEVSVSKLHLCLTPYELETEFREVIIVTLTLKVPHKNIRQINVNVTHSNRSSSQYLLFT